MGVISDALIGKILTSRSRGLCLEQRQADIVSGVLPIN